MEPNNPMPNNNQEESMYVEVDKNKKYYLVGSTNKKDSILFRLYFFIYIILIALSVVLAFELKNALVCILPIIVLFSLYVLFFAIKVKKDEQYFLDFMNDLDYEKLERNVLNLLSNEKIHPETKNYYLMRLVTFSPSYSKEKYLEYGNQVKCPKNKSYQINYNLLSFSNNMTLEELDQLYQFLSKKYKKNRQVYKAIQLEYKIQKAVMLGTSEEPIDQLLQSVGKTNYQRAVKTYLYAFYYANAHDKEKFQKYYNDFMNQYAVLKGFVEKLNTLKEELEKESL